MLPFWRQFKNLVSDPIWIRMTWMHRDVEPHDNVWPFSSMDLATFPPTCTKSQALWANHFFQKLSTLFSLLLFISLTRHYSILETIFCHFCQNLSLVMSSCDSQGILRNPYMWIPVPPRCVEVSCQVHILGTCPLSSACFVHACVEHLV